MVKVKMVKIKFEGVDFWNRAVFKDIDSNKRFGSLDKLFDFDDSETKVLKNIKEGDLCYFGNSFGCEPLGTNPFNIKIIGV